MPILHCYIVTTADDVQQVLSGGPGDGADKGRLVTGSKSFTNSDDGAGDPKSFCQDVGCNVVDCLTKTTTWFNRRYAYDPTGGGNNSNTFAYSAMAMCLTKIKLPLDAFGGDHFAR